MNNIEDLKTRILEANQAYRDGCPYMDDQSFDDLCDELETLLPPEEWKSFRNSLHEKEGKIEHPFIMGSLDKIKIEDEPALRKFLKKHLRTNLNVSAKVDGISCRLEYDNGILVGASSRGNGCLSYDSIIIFENGKKIPIGTVCDLKLKGKVLSYNEKEKKFEYKEILDYSKKLLNKKWLKITFEDNSFINITDDHLILTNRGWIQAKDLLESDEIKSLK